VNLTGAHADLRNSDARPGDDLPRPLDWRIVDRTCVPRLRF